MTVIETELDRLIDLHDSRTKAAVARRNLSRGVYNAHRKRALAEPTAHPLRRTRLLFREDGLTVEDLSSRALVSERTIRALENGEQGSDMSWARLARALDCGRGKIDPTWIAP